MLVAALSVSLLVGCATNQERRPETLSSEEYRMLYPSQHFDSLDPWERRDLERRMMEEDIHQRERERGR
jgi:hypothetical protein